MSANLKNHPSQACSGFECGSSHSNNSCTCRYCEGKLQFVARLKGNETVLVKQLAMAILNLLPVITTDDLKQLVQQLCSGFLNLWQLAAPFEEVIPVRHQLSPLQLIALAAMLHEFQSPIGADEFNPTLTSGIPPPWESVEEGVRG
jgi:hypothetical protein